MTNIYVPELLTIEDVVDEAPGVRTFRLVFKDEWLRDSFAFKTGQFALYSAFGYGESTFCIASSPTQHGFIQCTYRATGQGYERVIRSFHRRYHRFSRALRQ